MRGEGGPVTLTESSEAVMSLDEIQRTTGKRGRIEGALSYVVEDILLYKVADLEPSWLTTKSRERNTVLLSGRARRRSRSVK
jgi:hypothetical protein